MGESSHHSASSMIGFSSLRLMLLSLLIGVLCACSAAPSRRADVPSEMDAQTLFLQGEFRSAAQAFLALARSILTW